MKPSLCNRLRNRGYFSRPPQAFCIEKYNISRSGYHSKFHQILCLPRKVTLQLHRIVRLPRKVTVMTDPRHIWNVIYNARNNRILRLPPNGSPNFQQQFPKTDETSITIRDRSETIPRMIREWNRHSVTRLATEVTFHTAPSTKSETSTSPNTLMINPRHTWNAFVHCTIHGTTGGILQHHEILRLSCQNFRNISPTQMKRQLHGATDPRQFREWTGHETVTPQPASQQKVVTFHAHHRLFFIEKYNISSSGYHSKFHQILCLPRKVTLQLHRILRLPRKVTVITDRRHIWNVIYNARNSRWRPPAPPNTAPSAKWFSKFSETVPQTRWNVKYNARPIRDHSENDPRMKPSLRNPPRNWGYFSYCAFHEKWNFNFTKYSHDQSATHLKRFCTLYNTRNNRWHPPTSRNTAPFMPKFQKHFPNTDETSVTRRDGSETIPRMNRAWNCHSATRLATKSGYFSRPPQAFFYWKIQHFELRLPFQISSNSVPATKSDTPTSPNTAPATKSDCHYRSSSHMKRYLQCAEQQMASSSTTEYCAFRQMVLQIFRNSSPNQMKRQVQCATDPRPFREWPENETVTP